MQRIIVVRSDKCTASTDECNAQFILPTPIVLEPNEEANIMLLKVSFAHSYYLINQHTDALIINGTTITLEHGNYNAATMLRYLHDTLPISVAYTPRTYKFTFTHTSAFTIGSSSTCLEILGIIATQCDTSVTSLTGEHVADLHGIHSLRLRTNLLMDSYDSSSLNGRDAHLLTRIPVQEDTHSGASFRYEHYTPHHNVKLRVRDKVISEFTATLVDQDNKHVCFNGVSWTVKVLLTIRRLNKTFSTLYTNAPQTWSQTTGYSTDPSREAIRNGESGARDQASPRRFRRKRKQPASSKAPRRIRPRKNK